MKTQGLNQTYFLACNEDLDIAKFAREILEAAAQQGSVSAMLYLALIYQYGSGGVIVNDDKTKYWLAKINKLLPDISEPEDLYILGYQACFDPRLGVTKLEALKLLEKAGLMGHPEALWEMYEQTRYENPIGFDRLKILKLSAYGLNIQALVELANLIEKEDSTHAITLLKTAKEMGSLRAKEMLGFDE